MTRSTNSVPVPKCAWIDSWGQIRDINTFKGLSIWFVATLLLLPLNILHEDKSATWTIILFLSWDGPFSVLLLLGLGLGLLFVCFNCEASELTTPANHLHNYFYKSVWNTQRPNADLILFLLLFFNEKIKKCTQAP